MWKNINGLQFLVLFADNEADAREKFEKWEESATGEWYNSKNSDNAISCEPPPTPSQVLIFVLSEYTCCKVLSCCTIISTMRIPTL